MADFMMRALLVGGLATLAALCFEHAARHARVATRFGWTLALLGALVLPLVPRLITDGAAATVVPQIAYPTIVVSAATELESSFNIFFVVWLALSLIALAVYAISYIRLQRARRRWSAEYLANAPVYVSDVFGPAIFGFIRPRIVVPAWVRATSHEEQEMIVLHEREHVRAFDHLQVLLTIIATVVQPWNPFVWIQSRRLRFAIEADCDQRVLARVPDVQKYATLLVDVGSRQNGLLLTAALAEHRNGLERRLTMLAQSLIRNRGKAVLLGVVGIGVMVVACESRLPQEPPQPAGTVRAVVSDGLSPLQRKVADGGAPAEPTVSELMAKHYPPLLREAGIGGVVKVQARVHASGKVDGYELLESSGHEALDQAGMRVLREIKLFPTRTSTGAPEVTTQVFELRFDPRSAEARLQPTLRKRSLKATAEDQEQPKFTPYTIKPELANRQEVVQLLARSYPPVLRDAGIEGRMLGWLKVDESGKVVIAKVHTSSGRAELDEAGLQVLREMKFKPAENNGKPVAVWIQLPIVFKAQ